MITDWAPDDLVTEVRAADTAARAARAVPGVMRLQPGVWGLVRQLAAQAWERATGHELPDIAGVAIELLDAGEAPRLQVDLRIVVDGGYRAVGVAVAVQQAVRAAVTAAVDVPVTTVGVHIVEVDLDLA